MKPVSRLRTTLNLESIRQRLETSLTLYPALGLILALAASRASLWLDRQLRDYRAWYLFELEPSSARELLSTITSSLMTFTGLVFSITILVLQLASSQFSSRVLRTFLEDGFTRLSMAVFVGSFMFSMLLLPEVRDGVNGGDGFVPRVSVLVAFILVVASVGVFIRYIHHMAHSIRAVHVLSRVAADTRVAIERMHLAAMDEHADAVALPADPPTKVLHHDRPAGVITAVDEKALIELARGGDVIIGLAAEVGDFVPRGAPLFQLWGANERLTLDELRPLVVIGTERTPAHDPAFGVRQLVDVAERALSPGINDPTTAVQALDFLHDLLRSLADRRLPSPGRRDASGQLRLILPRPDWDAYVRLALDEIRQYGESSVQVSRRLRWLIGDLLTVAPAGRRAELEVQLELLDRSDERAFKTAEEVRRARTPSVQGQGGGS